MNNDLAAQHQAAAEMLKNYDLLPHMRDTKPTAITMFAKTGKDLLAIAEKLGTTAELPNGIRRNGYVSAWPFHFVWIPEDPEIAALREENTALKKQLAGEIA